MKYHYHLEMRGWQSLIGPSVLLLATCDTMQECIEFARGVDPDRYARCLVIRKTPAFAGAWPAEGWGEEVATISICSTSPLAPGRWVAFGPIKIGDETGTFSTSPDIHLRPRFAYRHPTRGHVVPATRHQDHFDLDYCGQPVVPPLARV